jgi:hypothetical protein
MLNAITFWVKWSIASVTMLALAAVVMPVNAQSAPAIRVGRVNITGVPDDWSHHHVVFSNPGTQQDAIKNGRLEKWQKIVNDPRYVMQQLKRNLPVQGPAAADVNYRRAWLSEAHSLVNIAPFGTSGDLAPIKVDPGRGPRPVIPKKRRFITPSDIKQDWNEPVDSPATQKGGSYSFAAPTPLAYPAKWTANMPVNSDPGTETASCANDFVIYPTGAAGAPDTSGGVGQPNGQASIIAYYNLYEGGCSGTVPLVDWAYNTGGAVTTAPVLSASGNQVAFIQSSDGEASLVLLNFPAPGTPNQGSLSTPVDPREVTASDFYSRTGDCASGLCMYTMDLGEIPYNACLNTLTVNAPVPYDTCSNPYYDYAHDSLYVGDSVGVLHKFYPVFTGPPAEVIGDGTSTFWPIQLANDTGPDTNQVASPVYDDTTGLVLVGTTNTPGITAGGYLYSVNGSTGAISAYSARLDTLLGIRDAVLLDPVAEQAYVFVGYDPESTNNQVNQFSVPFNTGSPGTASSPLGNQESNANGYPYQLAGTFDNIYYSSNSTTPTGNLYVCAASLPGGLYQIPITSGVMGVPTVGPAISDVTDWGAAACSPVTEFFNSSLGEDLLFLSVNNGLPTIGGAATSCYSNPSDPFNPYHGCVMSFDVTDPSTFTPSLAPLGTLDLTSFNDIAPTGGIIIDNAVSTGTMAGTSQIYFMTQVNEIIPGLPCVTGGPNLGACAVQASQAKDQQ